MSGTEEWTRPSCRCTHHGCEGPYTRDWCRKFWPAWHVVFTQPLKTAPLKGSCVQRSFGAQAVICSKPQPSQLLEFEKRRKNRTHQQKCSNSHRVFHSVLQCLRVFQLCLWILLAHTVWEILAACDGQKACLGIELPLHPVYLFVHHTEIVPRLFDNFYMHWLLCVRMLQRTDLCLLQRCHSHSVCLRMSCVHRMDNILSA